MKFGFNMSKEIIKYNSKLPSINVTGNFISDVFHRYINEYELKSFDDIVDLAHHFSKVIDYQISWKDLLNDLQIRLELLYPEHVINFKKYYIDHLINKKY